MKILICVNDLITDEPGLLQGRLIAQHFDTDITLLHILPIKKMPGDRDQAEQLLEQANQILEIYPVARKVRRGDPAKRIIKEARRGNYDLVIVTVSHIGEHPQASAIHRQLLKDIPCCLLVVKNPRADVRRMLICTSGLQLAEPVIEVGARFALAFNAEVSLFHVAANVPTMYTGLKSIEETLSGLLQTDTPVSRHLHRGAEILAGYNVEAELKLRHGEAVYEIVREIDLENYDMVVIGSTGANTRLEKLLYGNLTEEIVDAVGIPTLVVNQYRALPPEIQ
jgi:nucleotide-binding universal stress UspA family protein